MPGERNGFLVSFQSTHPHGVRHHQRPAFLRQLYVSIHAPARGATVESIVAKIVDLVSIHAPARGATATRL